MSQATEDMSLQPSVPWGYLRSRNGISIKKLFPNRLKLRTKAHECVETILITNVALLKGTWTTRASEAERLLQGGLQAPLSMQVMKELFNSMLSPISCGQGLGCSISLCMTWLLEMAPYIISHRICSMHGRHLRTNVNGNRLSDENPGTTIYSMQVMCLRLISGTRVLDVA